MSARSDVGWDLQWAVWGCAAFGDLAEQDAVVAEYGGPFGGGFWDLTAADLAESLRDVGRGWERVPDWYALTHLPFAWRESTFVAEASRG